MEATTGLLTRALEGDVGAIDVEQAAELLVRLCVSFVLIQDSVLPLDDPAQAAEAARRLIAPVVAPAA